MFYEKFDLLLALLVSLMPIGFFTTYLIAVYNQHVESGFPYISDTGTLPPESCIFAQFLTLGAFATLLIVFVRYHHVTACMAADSLKNNRLEKANSISFYIGVLSCIGVGIVGNFQETNVVIMHFIGAFLAFGSLLVYCWIQTFLVHRMSHLLYSSKSIYYLRIFLLVLATIFGFMFALFKQIANSKFDGKNWLKWLPTDGGFTEHVVSTASEWLLTIILMAVLLTFISDFRRIKISYPTIHDQKLNDLLTNQQQQQAANAHYLANPNFVVNPTTSMS